MEENKTHNLLNGFLDNIARCLLMNSSFSKDIGLYYGKAGALIFLYNYDLYKNEDRIFNYANELTVEVTQQLDKNVLNLYSSGVSGIAASFNHLVDCDFIENVGSFKEVDQNILSITKPFEYDVEAYGSLLILAASIARNPLNFSSPDEELSYLIIKKRVVDESDLICERVIQLKKILMNSGTTLGSDFDESLIRYHIASSEQYFQAIKILRKLDKLGVLPGESRKILAEAIDFVPSFVKHFFTLSFDQMVIPRNREIIFNISIAIYHFSLSVEDHKSPSFVETTNNFKNFIKSMGFADESGSGNLPINFADYIYRASMMQKLQVIVKDQFLIEFFRKKTEGIYGRLIDPETSKSLFSRKHKNLNIGITGLSGLGLMILSGFSANTSPWQELLFID